MSNIVWSPGYKKDKELIERVQHRFTRLFSNLKNLPYEERLDKLGLWTLEERRNRADLIEVIKIFKGISAVPFDSMFERNLGRRTRGHSLKLKKHNCGIDVRSHFFSQRVVNRWNRPSSEVVQADSVNSFKNRLSKLRITRMGLLMDLPPGF